MPTGETADGRQVFDLAVAWNGAPLTATVLVDADELEVVLDNDHRLQIPMTAFEDLVPKAIVAAHSRRLT